jgi:hypothetical protein
VRWLLRVFESAFVRKIAYLLAAALMAMIVGHNAHAQTVCYAWVGKSSVQYADDSAACASYNQSADFHGGTRTDTVSSDGVTGSAQNQQASCKQHTTMTSTDGYCQISSTICTPDDVDPFVTIGVVAITCPPTACAASSGKTFAAQTSDGVHAAGTSLCGSDGCSYHAAATSTFRHIAFGVGTAGAGDFQNVTGDGSSCTPATSAPNLGQQQDTGVPSTTCASAGGNISCMTQNATGKNCGTYNGYQVCVADIPPGKCVSYASGGVACTEAAGATAATTPPSPNSGTSGVPATPQETVTNPSGTTNYYNSTTVSHSTTATTTTGNPVPPVSGSGAPGAGTAPSAENGDCAATGTCASGATVPTLPTVPTIQSATQTYISAIQGAPIVAALASLSGSVPSGTCPAPSIVLWAHTFTLDAQCTLWDSIASVVSAIMLAAWVIMGVRILMSA